MQIDSLLWSDPVLCVYRADPAAQAVFPEIPRQKVTLADGAVVVIGSCLPFIYFVFDWWDLQRSKASSSDQPTAETVPAS